MRWERCRNRLGNVIVVVVYGGSFLLGAFVVALLSPLTGPNIDDR